MLDLLIRACIFAILAVSLNTIVGYAGILSIGHAAFFGIGAYASGIFAVKFGFSFWIGILLGFCISGLISFIIGLPTVRLKGDYLLIMTLGLCEIVNSVITNWESVTYGSFGINHIPAVTFTGFVFNSDLSQLGLILGCLILVCYCSWLIDTSQFGRILNAIRDNEDAAESLGINTMRHKITILIFGGIFASLAGSLYAHYRTGITPPQFSLEISIWIFSMVVLGGVGSIKGCVLGAVLLVFLPEGLAWFRYTKLFNILSSIIGDRISYNLPMLNQMLYGLLLIIMMIFRPKGMLGKINIG